ncbi:protein FMC1 homolog isoform 1-T1 [Sarcophilus harrisii]
MRIRSPLPPPSPSGSQEGSNVGMTSCMFVSLSLLKVTAFQQVVWDSNPLLAGSRPRDPLFATSLGAGRRARTVPAVLGGPELAGLGKKQCGFEPSITGSQLSTYHIPILKGVTSEKLCRAQHELHFQAATYLCLLQSTRNHVALHQEFHSKGERSVEEAAGAVGLKLPQQPGGKGWES